MPKGFFGMLDRLLRMLQRFFCMRVVARFYGFFQMFDGFFLMIQSLLRMLNRFLHMCVVFTGMQNRTAPWPTIRKEPTVP